MWAMENYRIENRSRQARSQKFAMEGGCFGGLGAEPPAAGGQWGLEAKPQAARGWAFGGKAPSRRRHGGLGCGAPSARKFCIFLQK